MGLDTVELVMEVEEAFGIRIPDAEAATLCTVGDLHRSVVAACAAARRPIPAEAAWERLRDLLEHGHAIPRREITPGARIVADLGLD